MSREDLYGNNASFGIPHPVEVAQFKQLLQQSVRKEEPAQASVLVLGPTPELRNIALELGCNVLSLDINLDMIQKREKYVTTKDPARDVAARGNWLNPWFLKEGFFSAILADTSFNNLPFENILSLFSICKKLLKNNGVLIFRHSNLKEAMPVDEIIRLYKDKKITAKEMVIALHSSPSLPRTFKNKQVSMVETYAAMASALRRNRADKGVITLVEQHQNKFNHSMVPEQEFEQRLREHFGPFQKYATTKLFSSTFAPIYAVKKTVKNEALPG
ncbi:class I SAM-dependent methyltransferase [Candidatus Woesearchaeota archaeon]|nr:class I SAM-dependent methyltransferase [Candidatus Woesearchaeota archaeon]